MNLPKDLFASYLKLHTWTGVVAGLALFVCFFAGSLTMFADPLSRWATPPTPSPHTPTARADLPRLIEQAARQHPQVRQAFTLYLQPDALHPASLGWREGEGEGEGAAQRQLWASLDEQGALRVSEQTPHPLGALINQLHQTAGIPGTLGHHTFGLEVMGVIAVLYCLALVSGLIMALPRLAKDFFALRPGLGARRVWLDVHKLLGLTILPFHFIIALTVVVFAFHDPIYAGLSLSGQGQTLFPKTSIGREIEGDPLAVLLTPTELIGHARTLDAGFIPDHLSYANLRVDDQRSARVVVHGATHEGRNQGRVALDPLTGQVMFALLGGDAHQQAVRIFFSMHLGSFGGLAVRWLYCLLGLLGAALFYTGNLLWLNRRERGSAGGTSGPPRAARIMAALTVGVCFGAVAGVAGTLLGARWAGLLTLDATTLTLALYYGIFLFAIVHALRRGAARAALTLTGLCTTLCGAIALTGLLGVLGVGGMWGRNDPGSLTIDVFALLAALGFWIMRRQTRQRLERAVPGSLWALMGSRQGSEYRYKRD